MQLPIGYTSSHTIPKDRRIATVEVTCCRECPFMQNADTQSYSMGFCTISKNYVGKSDLPDWCTLPKPSNNDKPTGKEKL